jgi:type IV pilus biogenesis protein CpaD/CtpE
VTAGRKAVRAVALGLILASMLALLAGCERKTAVKPAEARPVRTITAEKSGAGETVVLTAGPDALRRA